MDDASYISDSGVKCKFYFCIQGSSVLVTAVDMPENLIESNGSDGSIK